MIDVTIPTSTPYEHESGAENEHESGAENDDETIAFIQIVQVVPTNTFESEVAPTNTSESEVATTNTSESEVNPARVDDDPWDDDDMYAPLDLEDTPLDPTPSNQEESTNNQGSYNNGESVERSHLAGSVAGMVEIENRDVLDRTPSSTEQIEELKRQQQVELEENLETEREISFAILTMTNIENNMINNYEYMTDQAKEEIARLEKIDGIAPVKETNKLVKDIAR